MHEKGNENVKFGYLVKYSCNDFSQSFGILTSLCRTITNSMIPMRRDTGSANNAYRGNSRCFTVGDSVITMKTKDLHS